MDTDIGKVIHADTHNWNGLDFTRTCRQIFAETAHDYFGKRLQPLSTNSGISFRIPKDFQSVFNRLIPSQKRHITVLNLPVAQWCEVCELENGKCFVAFLEAMPRLRFLNAEIMFGISPGSNPWSEDDRNLYPWSRARLQFGPVIDGALVL